MARTTPQHEVEVAFRIVVDDERAVVVLADGTLLFFLIDWDMHLNLLAVFDEDEDDCENDEPRKTAKVDSKSSSSHFFSYSSVAVLESALNSVAEIARLSPQAHFL